MLTTILIAAGAVWALAAAATIIMLWHASSHAPIIDPLDDEIASLLSRADAVREQARQVAL